MTNPKDHDPRTDRPELDDDTEGHMPFRRRSGGLDHDDTTKTENTPDDTEGNRFRGG